MPPRSDDPLRRVTLNLYESDCQLMSRLMGQGWTTYIRELVHTTLQKPRRSGKTLGNLQDDQ
jgi:hypothetical protein